MERRKALAVAGASSVILFSGLVAATAVGGVKLFGFGERRAQAGATETPVVVNQVRYIDDMIVVIPQTTLAKKGPIKKATVTTSRPATTHAVTTSPPAATTTDAPYTTPPSTAAPSTTAPGSTSTTTARTTSSSGPTTTDN